MAGDTSHDEDSRRKHHRFPDYDSVNMSKLQKCNHHHRSYHHRSRKHEYVDDSDDHMDSSAFDAISSVLETRLKCDSDIEEGEILEGADEFGKRKIGSEEIEIFDHNLGVHARESRLKCNSLGHSILCDGAHDKVRSRSRSRSLDSAVNMSGSFDGKESNICNARQKERDISMKKSKRRDREWKTSRDVEKEQERITRDGTEEDSWQKYSCSSDDDSESKSRHRKHNHHLRSYTHRSKKHENIFKNENHDDTNDRMDSSPFDVARNVSMARLKCASDIEEGEILENEDETFSCDKKADSEEIELVDQNMGVHAQESNTKCNSFGHSVSCDGSQDTVRYCSRSRSHDSARDRSGSSDLARHDKRESDTRYRRQREHHMCTEKNEGRDMEQEISRDTEEEQWRRTRKNERENMDRKKERESIRHIYRDQISVYQHHMRRDSEMDLDKRREKGWDRRRDRGIDRASRRESERNSSRGTTWESGRDMDRNRVRKREKGSGGCRNSDRDGDRASLIDYRDSEIEDRWERTRRDNLRVLTSNNASLKDDECMLKRDEDEQEVYHEKISLQLVAQDEEDIVRITEESRRRRQAILEKYKSQQIQQQCSSHTKDEVKDDSIIEQADHMTSAVTVPEIFNDQLTSAASVPEIFNVRNDDVDAGVSDQSFSVGKKPPQNGLALFDRSSGAEVLGVGTPKSERSNDMFCDYIFGDSPAGDRKLTKHEVLPVEKCGLQDNWDDAEGYYKYRIGENLDARYEISAAHGKGVFSNVVRAKDLKAGNDESEVAIKIIRNNKTMYKLGQTELIILKKLAGADPEDKRHCVRFLTSFKYRDHLCLVFESLHMNLRELLKKFGRNIGLKLTAVRVYAKQLFIALKHLRKCGILHCDIKPDNMLVNEAKNVLKLCDFGCAMFAGKNEITPYLVSRFYRAPEIILGLPYDHSMDIWSVGCCLYELYTGKVLFPGPTNNDMLRLHMELKGPFPKKMLRMGGFIDKHFDQNLNFLATEEDPVTKKTIMRTIHNIKPKDIGTVITNSPGEDPKMSGNFKDLLDKIFVLDPEKRMTVSQALSHPFITDLWVHFSAWLKLEVFGRETLLLGCFFVESFLFLLMSAKCYDATLRFERHSGRGTMVSYWVYSVYGIVQLS